ncbi:MAG TPA: DUF1697 domain-containing protein [Tepidiformaceae bacterium]|nr:DUF1697 domain-containing protein [Tepidiformaceae bacterium]
MSETPSPGDNTTPTHVALLRGINVGGKNLIRMPDLVRCFEAGGFRAVATYIQSGNVIFASDEPDPAALEPQLEALLLARFGLRIGVVVRSAAQVRDIVKDAPPGFGTEPAECRYDVIYLKDLDAETAIAVVPAHPEVDRVHAGPGVLYYSRLTGRATASRLSRLASMPLYQRVTIRNWNTTLKLHQLLARS